ncbi:hypothetical protein BCR32DRAFT_266988 [Anaeromyces robustus]|uniref:Uncharacterized protein n=1 Tax=Anaeromyces robustus TaxID=1754192 RepID=A0A1Y1XCC0_9FUNG|nr:hypothetical protein BCR32DRAFT_266988 [Anaeromyces robustus]|eukprot:ORX83431.1 hypothetical protein BCR32DRAFT_266988 [Anaeromyces robustus]
MSNEEGFRRRFPEMEKFCCYFNLRTGLIGFTILYIISFLVSIFRAYISFDEDSVKDLLSTFKTIFCIDCVISIFTFITMISLLIGILKDNLILLKQFKYAYPITIFSSLVMVIITLIKLYSDEVVQIIRKPYEEECKGYGYYEHLYSCDIPSEEDIKKAMKIFIYFGIVLIVFCILYNIYYYICACSYIENIEESHFEVVKVEASESNVIEIEKNNIGLY